MIVGIGADIVDIQRIHALLERHGERFLKRVFTPHEIAYAIQQSKGEGGMQRMASALAKRFAAKEAVLKALGTGLRNGLRWHDIEVRNDLMGAPEVRLMRVAKTVCDQRVGKAGARARVHLSLSDEYPYAQAFVVLEANANAA